MASAIPELSQSPLQVVIVGHVDHGKSTLIGRLLFDCGQLSANKLEHLDASSKKRGMAREWAFALDALQAERDQAITIDTTQVWFSSKRRSYAIIDAPGHKEFLKNMVTGASRADAALILIDAKEGVQEQSRRHAHLLKILGINQIAVVVNKMDLVDYSEARFEAIVSEFAAYLDSIELPAATFVPVSASLGEGLAAPSSKMSWARSGCIVDVLDGFEQVAEPENQHFRFALQGVYKFDDRRILVGRVESGSLSVGEQVLFSPVNKISTVASIESFPEGKSAKTEMAAGESVCLTLSEQIFVERGAVMSRVDESPFDTNRFDAQIFWLGPDELELGREYRLKNLTQEVDVQVEKIHSVFDSEQLETRRDDPQEVRRNEVAKLTLKTRTPIALDHFEDQALTSRFVLIDNYRVAGGGLADIARYRDERRGESEIVSAQIYWSESGVTRDQREKAAGHKGAVVWLTGLSGSGKSTIARVLDQKLFELRLRSYILDGDNVRHGLNRDLGFSPEDRAENIRRIGEVGRLFADSGQIVVTAFISPYQRERELARSLCAEEAFFEVLVDCPLEVCEERDVKGLYKKARAGVIPEFTGISAPYEKPSDPDLVLRTDQMSIEACVDALLQMLKDRGVISS